MKLLVIAVIVSVPVTVILMHKYLGNYGYHINAGVGVYCLGIVLVLFTAASAVGYQLFYASRSNPAECLKYE